MGAVKRLTDCAAAKWREAGKEGEAARNMEKKGRMAERGGKTAKEEEIEGQRQKRGKMGEGSRRRYQREHIERGRARWRWRGAGTDKEIQRGRRKAAGAEGGIGGEEREAGQSKWFVYHLSVRTHRSKQKQHGGQGAAVRQLDKLK